MSNNRISLITFFFASVYIVVCIQIIINCFVSQVFLHQSKYILQNELLTRGLFVLLYGTMLYATIHFLKKLFNKTDEQRKKKTLAHQILQGLMAILFSLSTVILILDIIGFITNHPMMVFSSIVPEVIVIIALCVSLYDYWKRFFR